MKHISPTRKRLLRQAFHAYLQLHPEASTAAAELSLAQAVCLSPASIQKWRAGHPVAAEHVPAVVRWCAEQAGMDGRWRQAFLRSCDLCGSPAPRSAAGPAQAAGRDVACRPVRAVRRGPASHSAGVYVSRRVLVELLGTLLATDEPGLVLVGAAEAHVTPAPDGGTLCSALPGAPLLVLLNGGDDSPKWARRFRRTEQRLM